MAWTHARSNPADFQRLAVDHELWAALTERATVVSYGGSLPAEPIAGNQPSPSWCATFQAAVTALIPQFINHTINGGDFTGESSIPAWTESSILADIGASRIAAPVAGTQGGAWAGQQYDILDRLRWTSDISPTRNLTTKQNSGDSTWAAASSAFLSAGWTYVPSAFVIGHYSYIYNLTTTLVYISRTRATYTWITPSGTYDLAAYARFSQGQSGGAYINADYPTPEDTYSIVALESGHSSTSYSFTVGDLSTITLTEPSTPTPGSPATSANGWQANAFVLVLKHDVSGGLTYVS